MRNILNFQSLQERIPQSHLNLLQNFKKMRDEIDVDLKEGSIFL